MLSPLLQDIRFALRQLRKTPGFTTTAVLTLALGIGANAAVFTLVHAVLLKNLPVAKPENLVKLGNLNMCCVGFGHRDDGNYSLFSTAVYEHLKKNAPEFEELAAMQAGFTYRPIVIRRGATQENARSVMGEFVSGNYFRTFGLRPAAGRLFQDEDDLQGAPFTAVISYETWKNSYDGDPSVVGSTFYINTKPVMVVGVAPEHFYGDRLSNTPPDFYLPIQSMPPLANVQYVNDADGNWLYMIGRLKPGVSRPELQAKLSGLLRQVLATTRTYSKKEEQAALGRAHLVLTPGGGGIQAMQGDSSSLQLLMWTSALVLLIACANIANLLLARGMARKAEISVRTALGAGRIRIVRQLLTESVLLAGVGGLVGIAVAYAGAQMLLALAFTNTTSLPIHASPSPAVLGFACGVSLLTGILFGVAPAWIAAKAEPVDALRSGTRATGGASLLQRGLVVLQAALSLVLLIGAGLFAQSLSKLQQSDLKLESRNRYIVHMNPQAAGYSQRDLGGLYRAIEDQFHAIPGVEKVGIATYTPMEDNNDSWDARVEGKPHELSLQVSGIRVSPEYFDSVGTHVLMGRGIGIQDTATSATVAVVNETFVKKFFAPGENPIGHYFGHGDVHDLQIVGVVEDTTYTDVRWKDHLMQFVPLLQRPASDKDPIEKDEGMYVGALVLKTSHPIPDLESLTRRTLSQINPNLAVVNFQTFNQQIADQFIGDRMLARLTMLFGVLALLLAMIGLYGVSAYSVARRTSEIGIRMALGAERGKVAIMIMRSAVIQAALGLILGLPIAFLCVRFVKAQLYEVTGVNSALLLSAVLILILSASFAGWIPARRAASIEPATALRNE